MSHFYMLLSQSIEESCSVRLSCGILPQRQTEVSCSNVIILGCLPEIGGAYPIEVADGDIWEVVAIYHLIEVGAGLVLEECIQDAVQLEHQSCCCYQHSY